MLRRIAPILMALLVVTLLFIAGSYSWVRQQLEQPLHIDGDSHTLLVPPGSSLSHLSRQLTQQGLTAYALPLQLYGRFAVDESIHAGEYELKAGDNLLDLVAKLVAGDVVLHRITFPEGKTVKEWLAIIAADPVLSLAPAPSVDDLLGLVTTDSAEGWFFPDTYTFIRGQDGLVIFRQAYERMVAILDAAWKERDQKIPLNTSYEALILASIVEKETAVTSERGLIANVFIQRINKGMRLQTDPTVIYGLGDQYDGNLTRKHLGEENAYNTYRIDGLPPTPIANPGREAILAVMHPESGDSLYFVARGDGSHEFSKTLSEHRKAVEKYQLNRKEDYRSTPIKQGQ